MITVALVTATNLSGIASVTGPVTVSSEEANQNVNGEAIDYAGNTATTFIKLSVDKTPPVITITTPESKEYLASDNITLDFTVADALSDVSGFQATLNGLPVTNGQTINLSTMEGSYTLTVQANDKADNSASKSVIFTVMSPKALKNSAVTKLNNISSIFKTLQ